MPGPGREHGRSLAGRPGGGAGTPNGTGGTITHRVPGKVTGIYNLDVTGELAVPAHRDTSLSSTAYVASLFASGAAVTGGAYEWNYRTLCEYWKDASANQDGQGAQAGNITGKVCRVHRREPSPTPTPTARPTGSATPSPAPTVRVCMGLALAAGERRLARQRAVTRAKLEMLDAYDRQHGR